MDMKSKILCLGNEFLKEDSFAKEIGKELEKEGYEIINIQDSFQLMEELNNNNLEVIILDVAEGLNEVKFLGIEELSENKIISAHDFDAQFIIKLFKEKNIRILGVPIAGDIDIIKKKVKFLIER